MTDPGKLLIIATPIGNLEDLTLRARRVLGEIDALACEDTRHTRILLDRYDIARPRLLFSYHEHNEDRAAQRILGLLASGQNVGLCSNAGYPGISDPGYVVISQAVSRGFAIEVIPGASAVPTALLSSGLPTSSFTFKGFPPRKAGRKRAFLEAERDLPHTLVFYESPNRLGGLLQAALEVLGDRQAAVCIELTKMFEDVRRGPLSDLVKGFEGAQLKGEVAVVIAGNNPKFTRDRDAADGDGESTEGVGNR